MVNATVTVTTTAVTTLVPRGALGNMGKITIQNTGSYPLFVSMDPLSVTDLAANGLQIAASSSAEFIGTEGDRVALGLYGIATGGSTTVRVQF